MGSNITVATKKVEVSFIMDQRGKNRAGGWDTVTKRMKSAVKNRTGLW